ncbi:MAG TPA: hypothetical protein VMT03_26665 [Polyangia bacterium]|nr:hypothetical protein [Polyangia bacterium]
MSHLQLNARLWRMAEWLVVAIGLGWLFLWVWARPRLSAVWLRRLGA